MMDINTEPRFARWPVPEVPGIKLVIEHVEYLFVDGLGPVDRVWAVSEVGVFRDSVEANKAANREAAKRGWKTK